MTHNLHEFIISNAEFIDTHRRIKDDIHHTPTVGSRILSELTGAKVYLKCEMFQRTGSYKIRGPLNILSRMPDSQKRRGVICASAGNHAQGVALAAKIHGVQAVVVMAEGATQSKANATEAYGAEVIRFGKIYDDAYERSLEIQKQRGLTYIHPFDDLTLVAGQGTLGLELIQDCPHLDIIIVPIGGGGLIAGVAMAVKSIKPNVRIIGVESSGAPAMKLSLEKGERVELSQIRSIIDGLVVRKVGAINFQIARRFVDEVVLCSDEEIFASLIWLMQHSKVVAEGAAAAPVGALLNGRVKFAPGSHIGCVLSGGNLDVGRLKGMKWN